MMRAIELNPLDLTLYHGLARIFYSRGDLARAELTLRRAIEIDPLSVDCWRQLGIVYTGMSDWRSALDAFERICSPESTNISDWVGLGMASIAIQDLPRASTVRDELFTRFPQSSAGWLLAGHIDKLLGRPGDAETSYRRALEIDHHQTDALFNLVDMSPPPLSDPLTARLNALRSDPQISVRDTANVAFSLARIYEHAGLVDQTMTTLREANEAAAVLMCDTGSIYDPKRSEQEADWVIKFFDSDTDREACAPLDIGTKLIFVVGMPRSGTTIVDRVLSSHPLVVSGGELPWMQHCLTALRRRCAPDPGNDFARMDGEALRRLLLQQRRQYMDALLERELDAEYVVDKLPANFTAIGLIRLLFPDARIIHCSRNPVATCFSLYAAYFGTHLSYYTSLEHLVHYFSNVYMRVMSHWLRLFGDEIITVRYEDFVAEPKVQIRRLLDRCGLPWEEACLRPHDNARPIYTANMRQARMPLHTDSVQRWRKFENHLGTIIEGLRDVDNGA